MLNEKYLTYTMNPKQIFCPIHGIIGITPLMKKIIDTPEFKRLHGLRQLGAAYLVYPSANHTRFEHSIGVAHLAGIMIKHLQQNQPELEITDRIVELVQIAGLVHDIGHGPFSHMYDEIMEQFDLPEHEERGIKIFKSMIDKYNIALSIEEINIIINMINPEGDKKYNYLYQIVANKVCSVDVDKMDYLQRDSYHLGFSKNINYDRLLTMCRVVQLNGQMQLAWPEKVQHDILMLFETRYRLHKTVYYHHAVKSCEFIIKNILTNIIDNSEDKNCLQMSSDMIIYMHPNENLNSLREQLDMRLFPKLVGEKVVFHTNNSDSLEQIENIESKIKTIIDNLDEQKIQNTVLNKFTIGFISGNGNNPLKNVIYFNNKNILHGFTLEHYNSFMEPKNFKEYIYRVYVFDKNDSEQSENIWNTFIH